MKKLKSEEIKKIEQAILDYIDSICKTNNIKYYISDGTLLGAVRHKGFIPWDDDIDISMPRSDYNRFISIMSGRTDRPYKFQSFGITPKYFYEFSKVVDTRTTIETPGVEEIPDDGVWVDVFPVDYLAKHYKVQKKAVKFLVVCRIMSVYKKFPKKHGMLFFPLWCVARCIGPRFFLRMTSRLCKMGDESSPYIGCIPVINNKRYYYEKNLLDELEPILFEGKYYPAPKDYKTYLTYIYGSDYMTPPPENKRLPHPVEAYWK